jgi:hypothetical protein
VIFIMGRCFPSRLLLQLIIQPFLVYLDSRSESGVHVDVVRERGAGGIDGLFDEDQAGHVTREPRHTERLLVCAGNGDPVPPAHRPR